MKRIIKLTNFRNFAEYKVDLPTDTVVSLVAPNASGKSNFLEALYLIATGFSSRTTKIKEAIKWQENWFRLSLKQDLTEVGIYVSKSTKKYILNRNEVNYQDLLEFPFSVVFFQPADLYLLTGSPGIRRRYLDRLIGQLNYEYIYNLGQYNKLLKQKNSLLKKNTINYDFLVVIEERLSSYAGKIVAKRAIIVRELNYIVRESNLKIEYSPSPRRLLEIEEMRELTDLSAGIMREKLQEKLREKVSGIMREKLRELREKERELGFSLTGPQRDDVRILLQADNYAGKYKDLGDYGSRGEQRFGLLNLKYAEGRILAQKKSTKPLFLLDDVMSEFDQNNKKKLLDLISDYQVIITAADEKLLPAELSHNSRIELPEKIYEK